LSELEARAEARSAGRGAGAGRRDGSVVMDGRESIEARDGKGLGSGESMSKSG
jgi:hypothetical protein